MRSDLDSLLLPLLELLYKQDTLEANHMYMLLIIILMLSQEPSFSSNVHNVDAPPVPWYTERAVGKCSLGSIVVMVLCRTAQANLFRHNDAYLHTSTLAALTNMAPHFRGN